MSFKQFLESEDYANQITSGEWNGKHFDISVGKAYEFASKGNYLQNIPTDALVHDLSWWEGDENRMKRADTNYPLLVFKMPNGHLTVADGLNRLKKATSLENKKKIQAYVVPFNVLPREVFINEVNVDKSIVSTDFDGVLHLSMVPGTAHPLNYWDWQDWEPNKKMHAQVRKEAQQHIVVVVSKRDDVHQEPMWEFVNYYNLPIEQIYTTSDRPKRNILVQLGAIRHYDDDYRIAKELQGTGIEFIFVKPEG